MLGSRQALRVATFPCGGDFAHNGELTIFEKQARVLPWVYAGLLAATGVYICREAFLTEASGHFSSIRGEWLGLARIAGLDWLGPRWWPYWGAGAPIQYAYAPLIPFSIAALAGLFHCSPAMALNALIGLVYCLGPVTLYFAAWRLTKAPGYSFMAGLIYLAAAPPGHVEPGGAYGLAWFATTRRAYRLFEWDDLPHLTCVMLLPIAVWLLARAIEKRRPLDYAPAGAALAGMMLANMFGFVLAALAVVTVPLAMAERFRPLPLVRAALVAAGAYLLVSPWAPPSLLMAVHADAALDGEADWSARGFLALAILVLAMGVAWRLTARFIRDWPVRWMALFACPALLIPALDHYWRLHFLPQPYRYQIEMELALALLVPFALRPAIRRIPPRARVALALPLLFLAGRQVVAQRRFAKVMLRPANVAKSIEYRTARWLEDHLPGQRVMAPGSIAAWLNAYADSPQMAGQAYNTAPNWTQQLAVYMIYSGLGTGDRDAEVSILWMKAFGVQAAVVSGPQSPEYWKPFPNPRKFDGVLPVLWREDDTTIYRVPQSSASLAHVMRPDQVVRHKPRNGADTSELGPYAAALDNLGGAASFEWRGANRAAIRARLEPGQVVSAQVTYDRGWRATVGGSARRLHPDGIGLTVIEPQCVGECEIALEYTGGWESKACRAASLGTLLAMCVWMIAGAGRPCPAPTSGSSPRAWL